MTLVTPQDLDLIMRLFAATLLGGIIGFEREVYGKDAGFRTYTIVCIGAALIMVVSIQIFDAYKDIAQVDPARIAAQVVSGVGFLGAGAVIRAPQGVKGLTTAAGIWVAAGIGLACGMAHYKEAIATTILVLIVLQYFPKVGKLLIRKKKA